MGLFVVRTAVPGIPLVLPVNEVAAMVLVVLAVFRRPTRSLSSVSWFLPLCALLLGFLVVESIVNDVPLVKRAGSIAILMLLALFIAGGRIDVVSGLKGLAVALALNIGLFYLGIAPNQYGGVLTGFLQDKNAAGLYYAVVPLLFLVIVSRPWHRVAVIALACLAVVLTDSRTSMAAMACALIWLVVGGRFGKVFKVGLGVALYLAFQYVNDNFSQIGRYSDRFGSDALRGRIDAAAEAKAAATAWYGSGLGEATVTSQGLEWFFHNSYLALWVEGGVVMLVAVLAMYLLGGFGWFTGRPATRASGCVEAATVALLLCATRIGEAFLTSPGFLIIGVGLALTAHGAAAAGVTRGRLG